MTLNYLQLQCSQDPVILDRSQQISYSYTINSSLFDSVWTVFLYDLCCIVCECVGVCVCVCVCECVCVCVCVSDPAVYLIFMYVPFCIPRNCT